MPTADPLLDVSKEEKINGMQLLSKERVYLE